MDEPFVGLDPVGISAVREFILKISKEREMAVLISSHQLSEIEGICERYLFISDSQLVDYSYDNRKKVVIYTKEEVPLSINSLFPGGEFKLNEKKISFWFEKNMFNGIMEYLVSNQIQINDIELYKSNLESLFREEKV